MHSFTKHLGDYAKDTRHLTLLEHGAYNVLMDWCYASERALPRDEAMLYRICAAFTKPEQQAVMSVIEQFFQGTPDGWIQKRIEQELMKAHEKRGKAKQAALSRWDADAMPTQSERNADAMRTHNERNADAMPRARALRNPVSLSIPPNPRDRGKSGKLTEPFFSDEVSEAYRMPLRRWFEYKLEQRKGYLPIGWQALLTQQLRFSPEQVAASVEASMSNNWAGLFTEKITNPMSSSQGLSWQKKEKEAALADVPESRGTGAPDGWELAMVELWGDDWQEVYAAWELMPQADQRQVRAWLDSRKEKGGELV
jgi:uncharacterized protein YdaU (DUF1376 family)